MADGGGMSLRNDDHRDGGEWRDGLTAAESPVAPAIEVVSLVKDFPAHRRGLKLRAVDHVSFSVAPGSIFGLLGPNGSGKSTTLKIVLGLLEATAGSCRVFGHRAGSLAARQEIGFLPEAPYFPHFLQGREVVELAARLQGLPSKVIPEAAAAALAQVGLTSAAQRPVRHYSKGMLQRLGLAQAVVHRPRLLILDEPTAGVDPLGAAEIARLIEALRDGGTTIILCSHWLDQVEQLCSEVAIMHFGRLLACGTVTELTAREAATTLEARNLDPSALPDLAGWLRARGAELESAAPSRMRLQTYYASQLQR